MVSNKFLGAVKKSVAVVLVGFVVAFCLNGCWIYGSYSEAFGSAKERKSEACKAFEKISMDIMQDKNTYGKNINEAIEGMKIVNFKTGELKIANRFDGDGVLFETFYCPYFKATKTLSSETKSFAVNGNGDDDFNVEITKEVISADKIKDGSVLEKNIKITAYKIEVVEVITYKGRIHWAVSPYIKSERERLRNEYLKAEKALRNKLPCFESGSKVFCDGDLVRVSNVPLMIRVDKMSYGTVRYDLYYYSGSSALAEASYQFLSAFRMNPPQVYGNHYLKEEKLPSVHLLKIEEVETFKEW